MLGEVIPNSGSASQNPSKLLQTLFEVSKTEKLPVERDLTSLRASANRASSGGRKRHTFRGRLRLTRKQVLSLVRQHILVALVGALVGTYILFWVFTQFFVFCRDAYVKTDVVQVAPEVSGPILKLKVGDNDRVAINAVLFRKILSRFKLRCGQSRRPSPWRKPISKKLSGRLDSQRASSPPERLH